MGKCEEDRLPGPIPDNWIAKRLLFRVGGTYMSIEREVRRYIVFEGASLLCFLLAGEDAVYVGRKLCCLSRQQHLLGKNSLSGVFDCCRGCLGSEKL